MKVSMRRNPAAAYGCQLREGDTGTVDDALGRRLVAAGIADCLDEPAAPAVKAVPPPPPIEAKPKKSKARRALGPFYEVGDQ